MEEVQTTFNDDSIEELGGETINVIYDTNEIAE